MERIVFAKYVSLEENGFKKLSGNDRYLCNLSENVDGRNLLKWSILGYLS